MNKCNNINNKVKNRQKKFDWSKLISGSIWWIIITIIITSFISITCDNKIINFLYPTKLITNINTVNLLEEENHFIKLIKDINNIIFFNCKTLNEEEKEEKVGGGLNHLEIEDQKNNTSRSSNRGIGGIFKFVNFFFTGKLINKTTMEIFTNYLKEYNCELFTETLQFQNEYVNNFLSIFKENKEKKENNFRNISKIIISPIIFVLKPIIVFILGYFKFFLKLLQLTLRYNENYDLFFKFIFGIVDGILMNLFVFFPIFILQIIIHIFTFTLLPLIIINNNSKFSIMNILNNEGMKPFLGLMFILFNIPFFNYLINYIQL